MRSLHFKQITRENMLRNLAENIWVAEDNKFSVGGLRVGTKMTLIRLGDGGLFVHSPVAVSKALKDSIDSTGTPKFIIAPNTIHHLFVKEFHDQYPGAGLYVAPGLKSKRNDLSFATNLSSESDYPWNSEIKQHSVMGIPKLEEVVFYHPQSKTLVLTDLAFHITSDYPLLTRIFFRLNGTYEKFGPSRMFRLFFLKDKSEFKKSVDHILEWDFERIIMAHGKIVEEGGRNVFKDAFNVKMN